MPIPSSPATVITRALLQDRVYEAMHAAIVTGRLMPGDPIRERDAAEQFGGTVASVRNAVRRLHLAGLVLIRAQMGTFVSEIDVPDLKERLPILAEVVASDLITGLPIMTSADDERRERAARTFAESRADDAIGELEEVCRAPLPAGLRGCRESYRHGLFLPLRRLSYLTDLTALREVDLAPLLAATGARDAPLVRSATRSLFGELAQRVPASPELAMSRRKAQE